MYCVDKVHDYITICPFIIITGQKVPLHYSVESDGNSYIVQVLLSKGASIDCVDKVSNHIIIIAFIKL